MATIKFKAKVHNVYNHPDDTLAYQLVDVPVFKRIHCDMVTFRNHPRYGFLANSDMFVSGVLTRIRSDLIGNTYSNSVRLDRLPANMVANTSGFLAVFTIEV